MGRLILSLMTLASAAIVVGFGFGGELLRGILYGALVIGAAVDWKRARASDDPVPAVADRVAIYTAFLALALAAAAPWEEFEAWVAELFS